MRDFIGFRLRKQLDDDIRQAVKDMESGELSEKARDGLRWALGFTSTKRVEIIDQPLVKRIDNKGLTKPVVGKSAVYVPQKRGV